LSTEISLAVHISHPKARTRQLCFATSLMQIMTSNDGLLAISGNVKSES